MRRERDISVDGIVAEVVRWRVHPANYGADAAARLPKGEVEAKNAQSTVSFSVRSTQLVV